MATATRVKSKLHNEELKDAYRGWLKDLYDEKPERVLKKLDSKKKRGSKHRLRQAQRMLHVQQPTAASALKDVALNKEKLPVISLRHTPEDKQNLQDSQLRRHQALVAEANYSAFQYASHPSWRPGIALFQQLVRQLLPKSTPEADNEGVASVEVGGFPVQVAPILLRVPLHRQGGKQQLSVALLFCQEQNQEEQQVGDAGVGITSFVLHCRVYLRAKSWREHRNSLLDIVSNASAEICALRKCAEDFESRNNELQLLRSRQEVEKVIDELWTDEYDTDLLAIQKYVPFKGAINTSTSASNTSSTERKAWIARCASRKRDKNSSTVWILSGGDTGDNSDSSSTAITNSTSTNCQLVKCTIDQAWAEPRLVASMCTAPLEKALRIRFNELVVDLIQDTSGMWWLLQVKAFSLPSLRPASAASVSTSRSKKPSASLSRTQSAPTGFDVGIATSQWKKWRCAGRFCVAKGKISLLSQDFDEKEPCGYLTKKMLRSCEFYDDFVQHQDMSLAGGFTEFHSALGFHLQHRLSKRDRSQLYEPQPLCSACVTKYHLLRQQWIETVDAPKSSTESNLAGNRKKNSSVKNISESTPRINSGFRKLPALRTVPAPLNTSSPAPAIPFSTHPKSLNTLETASNQPNYLDELAAMEKVLAEHEPSSLLNTAKAEPKSAESQTSTATSLNLLLVKPGSDDIFPNWDGVTRIEEMWQNLTFKPIEKQLTESVTHRSRKKQGYNSISLKKELAKAAEMSDNNDDKDVQTNHEAKLHNEEHQCIDLKESNSAHRVHIQHCRRVFEDEIYREDLVNDALSVLRSGKASVCFVVPPPNNPERKRTDGDDELAEMALRSLYIDVKQAIASVPSDFPNILLSSWPMRPKICHETSGCITVELGPSSR